MSTTNDLRHSITITKGNLRTTIKIRLNDECKNGHEDFAITADVYEQDKRGRWTDYMGGCCHEHILELRPDLKPFVNLHLCTWEGLPMHCVSNAWYWFAGMFPDNLGERYTGATGSSGKSAAECRRIFSEHLRLTESEVDSFVAAGPRSKDELQALIEDMGLPARWRAEAASAITQLESWTGKSFKSTATRGFWEPLPESTREEIKRRRESGYYSPNAVAARDEQAKRDRIAKKLAELQKERDKSITNINARFEVMQWLASRGFELENWIYYSHTKTFCLGWRNPAKPEEVNAFLEVAPEFPARFEIECADGRKLSN